jgi:two-component system cell cycle sensor histidine kinase/response regulator CckA
VRRPRTRADAFSIAGPYALALLTTGIAIAVTHVTWPFFSATPFIPLYAAVLLTSHFGSGPAGLVALALTIVGAGIAFPGTPFPVASRAIGVYVLVTVVSNRVLVNRNRVEAALRTRDAELHAVWQHAGLGVALLDRDGCIIRVNPAFQHLFRAASAAYAGTSFAAYTHDEDLHAERTRFAQLMASGEPAYQNEHRFRRHDGTWFWGRVTVSAIREESGRATGAMAILEDVSPRRQAEQDLRLSEEKLRSAQKLEAIGRLVAGVAHNFNNLLTVTRGYAELLLTRHPDTDPDRDDLEEILTAADRGSTLAKQLLAFGRRHDARARHVDLNRIVCDLRAMLARVIREDIRLILQPATRPATVLIDPHDVEQLLLNLVINARDAMPMGGQIVIALDVGPYPIEADERDSAASRDVVRLRVSDTGEGMTPDIRAHLFEPFFTTKDVGQGTGLGLAFVDGVVRHHHGAIDVTSTPREGTTFTIYLPIAPAPPATESAASPVASPAVVRSDATDLATILLVEDESPLRALAGRMLERAGYRVLSAASPADACALFDTHASEVSLLVTDVVMPEMHGSALAQRLVSQRPDLRVLFMSGYSEALPVLRDNRASRRMAFLQKPFVAAHLVGAVETLLRNPDLPPG